MNSYVWDMGGGILIVVADTIEDARHIAMGCDEVGPEWYDTAPSDMAKWIKPEPVGIVREGEAETFWGLG